MKRPIFALALTVAACNTAPEPSNQSVAREPEFLVTIGGREYKTHPPSLDVSFYSDSRVVVQPISFAVNQEQTTTGLVMQPKSDILSSLRLHTRLAKGTTAAIGATLYLDDVSVEEGTVSASIEKSGDGRRVRLVGKVDGAVPIEFSGPMNVNCLVPRSAIPNDSLPTPPVAVGAAADEVLVGDDAFASAQCQSLLKSLALVK
jgi:hypothetical protein